MGANRFDPRLLFWCQIPCDVLKISLFCKRRRIGWAAASRRIPGLLVADTTPTDAFHRYGAFANQRDGGAGQNGPVDVSHPRLQQSHGKSATKKRIISSKRSGSTCVQWSSLVRSKGCWIITLSASGLFAGDRCVDWKRKEKRTEKRLRRTIVVV